MGRERGLKLGATHWTVFRRLQLLELILELRPLILKRLGLLLHLSLRGIILGLERRVRSLLGSLDLLAEVVPNRRSCA